MTESAERGRFRGTVEIFQYNRHQYLAAGVVCLIAIILIFLIPIPAWFRTTVAILISLLIYWTISSLVVSYIVYDASRLYSTEWLRELIPNPLKRWANIHVGLDNCGEVLQSAFGRPSYVWDVFNGKEMTEPSLLRARKLKPPTLAFDQADFRALPCVDGELDAIFLMFVAHEMRNASARDDLFGELRRCLVPGGELLLLEHMRDLPNFLAFGPGCIHFWPRSEWLRLAQGAGLTIEQEKTITPFVRVFLMKKRT